MNSLENESQSGIMWIDPNIPPSPIHVFDRQVNEQQCRNKHQTCYQCSDYLLFGSITEQRFDVFHVTCGWQEKIYG